ncbi:MAG TPA: class I SAM-dependent methyltransferase, partial [Gemmatimonadales bacterium]
AAGLDARPWRLPLPAGLHWVDVDQGELLDLKENALATESLRCRYDAVRLDLSVRPDRQALLRQACSESRRTLVITEGLLVYLEPEQVAELASDLHAEPSLRLWLLDLASPGLLTMLEKSWGPVVRAGKAPFKFGPAESTDFFRPYGWREIEWRSQFHEGLRLNRVFPMARFWNFMSRFMPERKRAEFLRFAGIALLERAEPPADLNR